MRLFHKQTIVAVLPALSLLATACSLRNDITDSISSTCSTDETVDTQRTIWYGESQITYYTKGPADGPILIFLHGWPGIAEIWRYQIDYFSSLGYFVVAPDMPGFGRSSARNVTSDYAHENIVKGLLAMLADTERTSATWIGHDWGAGIGSSLVAVHPEVVDAMAWLTVPYKTLELGYEYMLQFVNRTVYPDPPFHYAQWDYQRYYNTEFDRATGLLESDYSYSVKALYARSSGNASAVGTRSSTAYLTMDHGRFCGIDSLPPPENITCAAGEPRPPHSIPLNATVLTQDLYHTILIALENTTFAPGNQYYLNQQANWDYVSQNQKNKGILETSCLFIQADYDRVCDTIDSTLLDPMPAHCGKFEFASLPTGHWVQLEAAEGTNGVLARWLMQQ